MKALSAASCNRFGLSNLDGLCFQYVDQDNDTITVTSNEELHEAVSVLSANSETVLRMTIATAPGSNKRKREGLANFDELRVAMDELETAGSPATGATPTAEAVPTEEHLKQLLMAAIEVLELDKETTLKWVAGLKAEDVKKFVKASPISFISTLLACRGKAESRASAAAERASSAADKYAAKADEAADKYAAAADVVFDKVREVFAATAAAPTPSTFLRNVQHHFKDNMQASICKESGDAGGAEEPTLLPQECRKESHACEDVREVVITDTDGDTMIFKLTADGARVQEWYNGSLEIDDVKHIEVNLETGQVRDSKGRFTVRPEERQAKLEALSALLARVGARQYVIDNAMSAPSTTVHIDLDLDAPESEQHNARELAGAKVRQACETMGADPQAALKKLAAVFGSLPIAHTAQGQRVSSLLSGSVFHRQPSPYSMGTPRPPEPFYYASGDQSEDQQMQTDLASSSSSTSSFEKVQQDEGINGLWSQQLKQLREVCFFYPQTIAANV